MRIDQEIKILENEQKRLKIQLQVVEIELKKLRIKNDKIDKWR